MAAAVAASPDPALVFEEATGAPVELDLRRGPEQAVREYLVRTRSSEPPAPPQPGRGRPRLGVVSREVTLLPRHWAWLASQPGGASAALRRLVEDARRTVAPDPARQAREALYRIMSALAGNLPGFEEACRALFAGDVDRLRTLFQDWPPDVAAYLDAFVDRNPIRPG